MNININYRQSMYKILVTVIITITTTIVILATYNYCQSVQKIVVFEESTANIPLLRVVDRYGINGEKSLSDFFSEEDSMKRMKGFSEYLNQEFEYLEFDNQSLLLRSAFNFKDEFREDYGSIFYGSNDDIGISLKSIQINDKAYEILSLDNQIIDGDGFKDNDYMLAENKPIPAILGHEYSKLINIGDTLDFNYLSKEVSVVVIGFLNKDTVIAIDNQMYFMDTYIIIPSLIIDNISHSKDDLTFEKILYSLKNWGYIKISDGDDYFYYKNKIDKMSQNLDICYIVNEGSISEHIKNISNTLSSNRGIFFISSIIIYLIFSLLCIIVFLYSYNKNTKIYAIHLICGSSLMQIKKKIFCEIIIQFIVSFFISVYLFIMGSNFNNNYISDVILFNEVIRSVAMMSFAIMIITLLIINKYINKSDVYMSLRKDTSY